VDVEAFAPKPREQALAALLEEVRRDPPNPTGADERLPDPGNAERFRAFFAQPGATVVYVGKLLENKGVHLLLEALKGLDAKAIVVGFGDFRSRLEQAAGPNVLFTGALEHRHLVNLLPLADVAVAPSVFPEAFGMVAAEAAAGGGGAPGGGPPPLGHPRRCEDVVHGNGADHKGKLWSWVNM
jgi:glycosyltransferase involved in cell wall biosynthesis